MSFEILKNRRKHGDRDCFLLSYQVVPKHAQKLMAMWLHDRLNTGRLLLFLSQVGFLAEFGLQIRCRNASPAKRGVVPTLSLALLL